MKQNVPTTMAQDRAGRILISGLPMLLRQFHHLFKIIIYFITNLRLVLDVEVQAGNQSASKHSSPGLWHLLERIGRAHWPAFIRGDRDWGTQANMARAEQEGLDYRGVG